MVILAEQSENVEGAVWTALRALEEQAALYRRMAQKTRLRNQVFSVSRYDENAQALERHANVVRQILQEGVIGKD
jgi:two-component system chemotaxis response regulator CheB